MRRRERPLAATPGVTGPFPTVRARRRYWTLLSILSVPAVAIAFGLLAWDNPMPVGTEGFWLIAELRATNVIVIASWRSARRLQP